MRLGGKGLRGFPGGWWAYWRIKEDSLNKMGGEGKGKGEVRGRKG